MLKNPNTLSETYCLKEILKEALSFNSKNPRINPPASSIRKAVRKIGGLTVRAIFASAKQLDQRAYTKKTKAIDIEIVYLKILQDFNKIFKQGQQSKII